MTNLVHREEINLYDVIKKSFPDVLIKDLTENERICPVCNGLGMRIEDNIYGIKGDNSEVEKNIVSRIDIKLFHFVEAVSMVYKDYALIVGSLTKIKAICIVIVMDRKKLMKKRE